MIPTFKKHRPQPYLADHPVHLTAATHLHIWGLHVGWIQLFIAGPGPDAWLACSESYYYGQVGTEEERNLARRAVAILNRTHRQNNDAGPSEIRAALTLASTQDEPIPESDDCEISQLPPEPLADFPEREIVTAPAPQLARQPATPPPTPALSKRAQRRAEQPDIAAILAIVESVAAITGVTPAQMIARDRHKPIVNARHLAIGAVRESFPALTLMQIGEVFHRDHGSVINSVAAHRALLRSDATYQTLHSRIPAA